MVNTIKICNDTRKIYFISTHSTYKISLTDENFYCDEKPRFYDYYDAVIGILNIRNVKYLVYVNKSKKVLHNINLIIQIKFMRIPFQDVRNDESEITSQIKNFIETNNFYYSFDNIATSDFLWNKHMQLSFDDFKITISSSNDNDFDDWSDDASDFPIANLYCGFCCERIIGQYKMSIVSLINSNKIGPRFYCRGVNDSGNVSFFVKTHTQLKIDKNILYSKHMLRGSIPLFWYQDKNPLRSTTKYSREKDVSRKAFAKHFEMLNKQYGKIYVINLLSTKDSESELCKAYTELLIENKIPYFNFDLNKHINDFEKLKDAFIEKLNNIDSEYTFRVNCLDCLDRTNIGQYLLNAFYIKEKLGKDNRILTDMLGKIFAENGHALSNFYCGADSLKSELTTKGKRSVVGLLDDLYINANRIISGKYNDKTKQFIINTILENDNSITNEVTSSVASCKNEKFLILSWCINNTKFSDQINFKFENKWNTNFAVICLQKIHMSYKKLLFDKKQEEREKWIQFFINQSSEAGYTLLSQNFHRDIGILLFVRKEISEEISDIRPLKFRQSFLEGNITVITNFVFRSKTFSISNSTLVLNKEIYKNDSYTIKHLQDTKQNEDYRFMTGYFESELLINDSDYKYYSEKMDYERLITHDFLNSNLFILKNFDEGEITFLPSGDLNKNDKIPKYSTRIFSSLNISNDIYSDVLFYKTGYRPVFGLFTITD